MSDYFVFGDVDSRDYPGIHVFDKSVDNTPKRVYEVKNIAGRNGAFYVDQGRYEDVEHSYGVVALTKSAGSNFINALVSQVGYHRLSDSFNENEFYLATLTGAVEAKVSKSTRDVNTFDITFTRQPQRFLKSGETAVSVASGGTITNPTLFEAHPLLMTKGYGTITIGTDVIDINNDPYGRLLLANAKATSRDIDLDARNMALMNTGDAITLSEGTAWRLVLTATAQPSIAGIASVTASVSGSLSGSVNAFAQGNTGYFDITLGDVGFVKGTTRSLTMTLSIGWTNNQGTTYSATVSYLCRFFANSRIEFEKSIHGVTSPYQLAQLGNVFRVADVYGDSTKTPLDETVYIDTDIGEAYTEAGGIVSSANSLVSLPAKLPTLKSGENTITYDDTITRFNVVPRWWEV